MSPALKVEFLGLAEEPGNLIVGQASECWNASQQFQCFRHLYLAQVLMDELHRHRSFANAGSHALDGSVTHIAHRKDAWHICFQKERISLERPALGPLSSRASDQGRSE